MRRFGRICKSVPTQGRQNHDACGVAGGVQGDKGQGEKCRHSVSLNFINNFFPRSGLKNFELSIP